MLVVPPVKEPLKTKTLPDTSTPAGNGFHPSRLDRSSPRLDHPTHVNQQPNHNQQEQEQQDDQQPQQHTQQQQPQQQDAPQNEVPKHLTKQQLNLHHEFLRLGEELMGKSPELFHQAVMQLTAKHNLAVATPATCVSDVLPMSNIARRRYTSSTSTNAAPRVAFRKYTLPAEYAAKEFYQCMACKERRTMNTFAADHSHEAPLKSTIRWYCPICDAFYAVTHRGYHIKSRHSDVCNTAHASPQQNACKRERAEAEQTPFEAELLPRSKIPRCCSNSSSPSAAPSDDAAGLEQWAQTPTPESTDSAPASDICEEQDGLFGLNMDDFFAPFGAPEDDQMLLGGAGTEMY